MTAALEGSAYPLSDVITSDIQLGGKTLKIRAHGFRLNMKVIDYLLKANFQLIFLNVGMTASRQLTDLLNKKQGCLATSTYHTVLLGSSRSVLR